MIAKRAKLNGLCMLAADGKKLFSIRMYHSLGEIWIGWRKNLFLALKSSIAKTFYYMFMILSFFVTPYFAVMGNLLVGTGYLWTSISLIGLIIALISGLVLCHELNLRKKNVFLFPIGAIMMTAIMINSMVQSMIFRRTEWRGRIYEK